MSSSNQFSVPDPPNDAISSIKFSPHAQSLKLVVSSWDKHAYIYELSQGKFCTQTAKFEHRAPVLDACFGKDDNTIYTACLDMTVSRVDLTTGEQRILSTHSNGVRSVVYSQEHDLLVSASWDSTLHLHSGNEGDGSVLAIELPSKPFALDISSTKLVIVMASRALYIYELQKLGEERKQSGGPSSSSKKIEPWQHRESSLKFMTRAIACMPNDEGYATSSIEGRVAVEWFDPSNDSQSRKYAFKCHRQPIDDVDVVYPVNAIAFHAVHGTFATGGGDGVVAIWDAVAKRRIRIYPKLASSIAGLSFSSNGKYLATAMSPGFEDGNDELPEGAIGIFLREIGENEVKRKAK